VPRALDGRNQRLVDLNGSSGPSPGFQPYETHDVLLNEWIRQENAAESCVLSLVALRPTAGGTSAVGAGDAPGRAEAFRGRRSPDPQRPEIANGQSRDERQQDRIEDAHG
jgi:hypothetical protein